MSCDCQTTGDLPCGCCTGTTRSTPVAIGNRPGLPSISYRVGTYSSFLASMDAALSGSEAPALASLRTRSKSDFSVALVDAWAEVLDVLSFYSERLANESYLGTAVEGRSVFELARLVGYKPSPGVSASTILVFTLASAPGSPAVVPIPAGTRVQSVPGPGQTPQTFETSIALVATLAANALPAAATQPWTLAGADRSTWIAGTANNIRVGDVLLFIQSPGGIPSPTGGAAVVNVTSVRIDSVSGNTLVSWDFPLSSSSLAGSTDPVTLYALRTKAALFGAAAPTPGLFPADTLKYIPGNPGTDLSADWSWQYAEDRSVQLDNSYPGLNPVASGAGAAADQSQWMVLTGPRYTSFFQVQSAADNSPRLYSLSAKTSRVVLASGTVLIGNKKLSANLDELLWEFVQETRETTACIQSQLLQLLDQPLVDWSLGSTYPRSAGMLAPVEGKFLLLSGSQPIGSNAPLGVTGKRVRIAASMPDSVGFVPAGATGALAVGRSQPFLVDAFPPDTDPSTGNLLWKVLTVAGLPGILNGPPGSFELLPSASSDPLAGEAVVVSEADVLGSTTSLVLGAPLQRIYDRPTVVANANAVEATHGETVQEILGSGDATNPALAFQLKQSPLTYVSAATSTGAQSTLQVRVNDLLWNEMGNFLSSTPKDRAFTTRPTQDGGAIVQFGDGIQGSRTSTGQSNIRAQYRKGIGMAGMVSAGQLTQPIDRPQGLQSVTNPADATGGADPATPAQARTSAPLPILTLGRVVSLEDYQNFALGFAGIGLALATWSWFGSTRGIFLTVAGQGGKVLSPTDPVVQNLLLAYRTRGLPNVPVMVASYRPVLFEVSLLAKVDAPAYDPALVLPRIWQNLVSAFSFGSTKPGGKVAASRVIRIAQEVPGVLAVELSALGRSGGTGGVPDMLCASGPGTRPPLGAEILLLDPASRGNIGVWS